MLSVDLLMLYDGDDDVSGVLLVDNGDDAFGADDDAMPLRKFDTLKLLTFFKSATIAAGGYD